MIGRSKALIDIRLVVDAVLSIELLPEMMLSLTTV